MLIYISQLCVVVPHPGDFRTSFTSLWPVRLFHLPVPMYTFQNIWVGLWFYRVTPLFKTAWQSFSYSNFGGSWLSQAGQESNSSWNIDQTFARSHYSRITEFVQSPAASIKMTPLEPLMNKLWNCLVTVIIRTASGPGSWDKFLSVLTLKDSPITYKEVY